MGHSADELGMGDSGLDEGKSGEVNLVQQPEGKKEVGLGDLERSWSRIRWRGRITRRHDKHRERSSGNAACPGAGAGSPLQNYLPSFSAASRLRLSAGLEA